MKRLFKKSIAVLSALIITLSCGFLSGCALSIFNVGVSSVQFVSGGKEISSAQIVLGQTISLNRYVSIKPSTAKNKSFTVVSDNENIVSISTEGSEGIATVYATAKSIGKATLTVTTSDGNKTATLSVTVVYAKPDSVRISSDREIINGKIAITQDDSNVSLTAVLENNVDPATEVVWNSTGGEEKSATYAATQPFTVNPQEIGATVVTATVTGENGKKYTDTVTINVYGDITGIEFIHEGGSLTQDAGDDETVYFRVGYDSLAPDSPEPIVQWFVNGEVESYGLTYAFLPPSAGRYVIDAYINGTLKAGTATVVVSGTLKPENVWVEFDNCYPKVYIRWDNIAAAAGFEVYIYNNATSSVVGSELNTNNLSLLSKFTTCSFDASDYMSTSLNNIFGSTFTVKVRTLGDSTGVLKTSDWSAPYTTTVISNKAQLYLEDKFYDGARNHYVATRDELLEWLEYAMLWRPSTLSGDGEKLYLDYSFTSALTEFKAVLDKLHFTGSYPYDASSKPSSPHECTFTINFQTVGSPSTRTSAPHSGEAWNAMRPHINYDPDKARSSNTVLPIDGKTPVTVQTSDQLYYMAQLGYRPVPKSGSAASTLYNYAKRTLLYIITDDMTDAEKVHAIYDWIMWRVIYDKEVLNYSAIADAVQYESYYLESVLTDNYYYGVCDAMSKAFVLLTRMEGIESIRVTGVVGSTPSTRGGHAWNKVKIDGNWYVVDCTWGDASVPALVNNLKKEGATHLYLLVSDSDVASTHVEDENISFPTTAASRYKWYNNDVDYGTGKADVYFEGTLSDTKMREDVSKLVKSITDGLGSLSSTYTVGPDSALNTSEPEYICYEIFSDKTRWGENANQIHTRLQNELYAKGISSSRYGIINMGTMGNDVHTLLFIKTAA